MRYGGVSRLNTVARFKIYLLQRRFFTQTFYFATSTGIDVQDVSKIRNVGIIAHIDAGKTTTTERMLYYSGHTRRIGNVDEGSTVTDFLPAERARGITIQSAAITFYWPPQNENLKEAQNLKGLPSLRSEHPHQINLIDTPGHADFTFEVRRSLRVLDGAICVLDGVAGVEAQTEQVWNQAAEWKIPCIVYVNKLDRDGAAFGRTVREIGLRLNGWPVVCHIPWFEGGKGRFCGIADVLNLCGLFYEEGDGKTIRKFTFQELGTKEPSLAEELRRARVALVELLSEYDDTLVEAFFLANEDHLALIQSQLIESLRRCLLIERCNIIPVFAGASFRNIGVQPLLDAVNHLLPSPQERPEAEVSIGEKTTDLATLLRGDSNLRIERIKSKNQSGSLDMTATLTALKGCALAFKVVNEARKGVLVYIRVYSGSIDRNTILYNTNTKTSERVSTLLRMYANESAPVQSIEAGQIGVIAGSKFARTGDTLIAYGNKGIPPQPLDKLQLRPIHVPPPVFFASLEPSSLKDEKDMHEKLNLLLREDPSLHVTQDEDTGQTLISGMGELHLEIARDRLVNDLRANATMGKIAIGYRETLTDQSDSVTKIFDSSSRGDSKGKAGCSALVQPLSPSLLEALEQENESLFKHSSDGNTVVVQTPGLDDQGRSINEATFDLPNHLTIYEIQQAYVNGALAALARGPLYSYPMHNVLVTLTLDPSSHIFGGETSYSALTTAARLATIASIRTASASGGVALMEPVMNVDINVDDASLGSVVHDISSSRGGQILSLGDNEEADSGAASVTEIHPTKIYAPKDPFESSTSSPGLGQQVNKQRSIKAKVPLKEMVGYLKHLRSMTGGRGTFTMSVDRFERMTGQREKALLAELQGGM